MITVEVITENRASCGFQGWLKTKNEETEHTLYHLLYYVINKHVLGSLVLLRW